MNQQTKFKLEDSSKILIIGMAGGLANITANLLAKHHPHIQIIGIDARPIKTQSELPNLSAISMRYTRNSFEKLFRENKFDAILHLGRLGHISFKSGANLKKRIDLNVVGTNRILELSIKYAVKKAIILSTYHVYGALPDNQVFIAEDAPLRASIKYPDLRDVVEMDQVATNAMWKHQNQLESIVLRPCSIIGPQIRNAMTTYLTKTMAPAGLDFNPMFQFIHEFDMANILMNCLDKAPTGIYNVAPDEPISIAEAKKIVNPKGWSMPISILELLAKPFSKRALAFKIPHYMVDYVKFPCLISNQQLKSVLGPHPFRYNCQEAVELLKLGKN